MVYVALLAVEHGLGDRARRGTTLASTSGPVASAAPPRTPTARAVLFTPAHYHRTHRALPVASPLLRLLGGSSVRGL